MPVRYCITDSGKARVSACSRTWSASRFCDTMNWARSPTTLLDGVTLGMSPRTMLASAYLRLISGHLSARPS